MRLFKRMQALLLPFALAMGVCACGGTDTSSSESPLTETARISETTRGAESAQDSDSTHSAASSEQPNPETSSHILVAYFSHTGENYNVGVIEEGNTNIIADMIAQETDAEMFEIQTVNPYPDSYDECTDVAKREQNENARPEIVSPLENLDEYDTVFIGYPIWWGDLPMAVYTFLERYDFSGKTVIPFCTHEGSGLSGTQSSIESVCSGATVAEGLAVRGTTAQNDREEAKSEVLTWLDGLQISY